MNSYKGSLLTGEIRVISASVTTSINYIFITNKLDSPVTINLYLEGKSGRKTYLSPRDLTLDPNESCVEENTLLLLAGENFVINTTGEVDYYITTV